MLRSDTWDNGNSLTRFHESVVWVRCAECDGRKVTLHVNSVGAQYARKCRECNGEGEYQTYEYT